MNKHVLNTGIQNFINKNLNADISSLLLKGINFHNVKSIEIVEQIEAKKKSIKKLPTWYQSKNIYYPNKLNIEQTSSEETAKYKANLIDGKSLIDLTGGFGIDSYYFSKKIDKIIHCEIDQRLSKIVTHNIKILGVNNIETYAENGLDFLQKNNQKYDWIYLDPSRRNDTKKKVFFLSDCSPNVTENLDTILKYSNNVLIKTSPLLDLTIGINELKFVKEIHIIAIKNDVKELLWVIENEYKNEINIKTINIKDIKNEAFNFILNHEKELISEYSIPRKYLYEPNSALLKAGAFNIIANKLGLFKLQKHSHLYTNDSLIDFPGRSFEIKSVLPYNKKVLKKTLKTTKANITTRNFPESVLQIRKKLNLKDGGDTYLIFTTNMEHEKIVIICIKS